MVGDALRSMAASGRERVPLCTIAMRFLSTPSPASSDRVARETAMYWDRR